MNASVEVVPFFTWTVLSRAETKGWFLPGVAFAKGCEFLLVSLGEGFGVGFRGVAGGGFPVEKNGEGEGGGEGGVGIGKGTGKSMGKLCRNYPLAIYPLVLRDSAERDALYNHCCFNSKVSS